MHVHVKMYIFSVILHKLKTIVNYRYLYQIIFQQYYKSAPSSPCDVSFIYLQLQHDVIERYYSVIIIMLSRCTSYIIFT